MTDTTATAPAAQADTDHDRTAKTSPSRLAEAAVHYTERGWYVFPLHHPVGGNCSCGVADCSNAGKHPRFAGGFHEATTDTEQIRTWWERWPDANIGLAPGPSGLVVIDIDGPAGEAAAEKLGLFSEPTWSVTTGRVEGGRHLYFRHPGNGAVIGNRSLASHVDVRADGGICPRTAQRPRIRQALLLECEGYRRTSSPAAEG